MSELERLFNRAVLKSVLNEGMPAYLGKVDGTLSYVDDNGTHHADRVWARIGPDDTPVETVVRCTGVPQVLNMPVIVADREGVLTVIRTDTSRALEWSGGQLIDVAPHNWTHGRYGPDPLYITGLAFLPLAAYPSSPPDLTVTVERCFYRYQGTHKVFERTTSASFAAYRPASTDVTHYVILALDRASNALTMIDGDDVSGGNRALPNASTVLATSGILLRHFPICAIRLYNGQTQIMPRDIFMDLRLWAGESNASGSGAGVWGPGSSTDNAIARWDGTSGTVLQDSYPTIDDTGNLDLAGHELRDYSHQVVAANTGAAYEIDWSAGTVFELTLTDNPTFTFANESAGRAITLILIQDGTGGRTVTWPGAVDWANGTAPRLSTTASAINVVTLICQNDGSTISGFSEGDNIDERGVVFSDAGTDPTNFFAGDNAGNSAASGTNNVNVGANTGQKITSGYNHTLIGKGAGEELTDGINDTCIGRDAGEDLLGDYNVVVGAFAGAYLQESADNAIVGAGTCGLAKTIQKMVVMGRLAGPSPSTSTAANCVLLGYKDGYDLTSGANHVCVGCSAGENLTTATGCIYLGYYAGYGQTTESNRLLIDNQQRASAAVELTHSIIYGTMAANPEDQQLTANVGAFTTGNDNTPSYGGYRMANDVAGAAVTIIANGTGDVTVGLQAMYFVSESAGGTGGGSATCLNNASVDLYDDGTDVLTLAVAADGSVTLQRTAGAATFDVSLWLVWI